VALRVALVPGAEPELEALAHEHPPLQEAITAGRAGRDHLADGSPAPPAARRFLPVGWCEPEPPTVELRLLGAPTVLHDGRDIGHPDWERARVRELCLHLALVKTSARDQIAARLWPDLARDAANRNLRVTLTYLLNVLDPCRAKGVASSLVDDSAGTLSLSSSRRLRIDIRDTTVLADAIRAGAASADPSTVVRAARGFVRIPGGDLLGGVAAGEWIEQADEDRAEQVLRAGLAGGPVLLRAGHPDLAEAIAQRGLIEDPWAERLHQVVVRARLARDDLDGARRSLRRALRALADLAVRPEPATVELARLVGIDATPGAP
jgi:DNA-binding SARP family transcriptional activator